MHVEKGVQSCKEKGLRIPRAKVSRRYDMMSQRISRPQRHEFEDVAR